MSNPSSPKEVNLHSFLWLIVSIIVFALLGVLAAKAQLAYEGVSDTVESRGLYSVVIESATQKEKHTLITYGLAGAGLGLVVGLFNASYRQRNK